MLTTRRQFLQVATSAAAVAALPVARAASASGAAPALPANGGDDRAYCAAMLQRVVEPVLSNLAQQKLRANMPVEVGVGNPNARRPFTHLEAFGRTLAGIAPWLDLASLSATEAAVTQRLSNLARQGLAVATDPSSADYMNFKNNGTQPLVDAAFLALGILRAPGALWAKLDPAVQKQVVACLQQTRALKPGENNWVLFSAMIEAFLAAVGAPWEEAQVDHAVQSLLAWYKGDGAYGDGPEYHWDYYNSYVMHPMLLEVLEQTEKVSDKWSVHHAAVLARAQRYAVVQERMIGPDGAFPPLGRSLAYRGGAFQLLALMALRRELPGAIKPAQVRGALTAVIRRTLDAPGAFDAQGWLQIGLGGHQPALAENYISTGSLYLCTTAFLPLGLPTSDPFWSDAPMPWTQAAAWSGQNIPVDHALPAGT
jgi:hypothetical protein